NVTLHYATVTDNSLGVAVSRPTVLTLSSFDWMSGVVMGNNADGHCNLVSNQPDGYNYEVGGDSCHFTDATDRVNQTDLGLELSGLVDGKSVRFPTVGGPLDGSIPVAACSVGQRAGLTHDELGAARPGGTGCEPGAIEIGVDPDPDPDPDP